MKIVTKLVLLTILIFGVSCANNNNKENTTTTKTVAVEVALPTTLEGNYIQTSGKVEAVQNANLSTRIMGYVNTIYVKVGDKVRKGQLLMRINSADINAQRAQVNASITEAEAAFNNAEKNYERFKALYTQNSASQKEMDDVSANYKMAKARLEAAKQMKNQVNAQLSYSNITAPFTGVVTGKFINKGDMANPGMPLLSVEAPDNFQVIAMVPESEITQIKENTKVNVHIKSIDEVVKGIVTEISTSTKNSGGQYLVKIILDNTKTNLLSGMYVSVQFPTSANTSSTILIPQNAIVKRGELRGVYVISKNNTALLRWLRLGKTFGDKIEVLSGLNEDEKFVVSANEKLVNGTKLQIQ